jgi:hypothetical protein
MQRHDSGVVRKVKYLTMTIIEQAQSQLYHYETKH